MFDLKQWAATNKVSNSQLCRLSGVSECTIASVMRGCSCTERTLKRICRGIERPYDPAEWRNPIKASLKPVPVVDYDRVRIYGTHVGVDVRLRTIRGNTLVLRKSFQIDDVVKWKGKMEVPE